MGFRKFEEIKAWQKARTLTSLTYQSTRGEVWARDHGLRNQIQRAAISIMSNIAEGFGANSNPEFRRFLSYTRRSALEYQSLLYAASDVGYLDRTQFTSLFALSKEVLALTSGLRKSLK